MDVIVGEDQNMMKYIKFIVMMNLYVVYQVIQQY